MPACVEDDAAHLCDLGGHWLKRYCRPESCPSLYDRHPVDVMAAAAAAADWAVWHTSMCMHMHLCNERVLYAEAAAAARPTLCDTNAPTNHTLGLRVMTDSMQPTAASFPVVMQSVYGEFAHPQVTVTGVTSPPTRHDL